MQSVAKGASSGPVDVIYRAQSRYPENKQSKPRHTHNQAGTVQLSILTNVQARTIVRGAVESHFLKQIAQPKMVNAGNAKMCDFQ